MANKDTSIDVDKFDYLSRDAYNTGFKDVFADFDRVFELTTVLGNRLCFHTKNDFTLYGLFQARYKLFKQVYFHKTVFSIELMMADILVNANSYFHFDTMVQSMPEYAKLTDSIIYSIENTKSPLLAKSQQILKNIRQRNLYKLACELISPLEIVNKCTEKDIINSSESLKVDDIVLGKFSIDYGCKDKNPIDSVFFYKTSDDKMPFHLKKQHTSLMISPIFQEHYTRIYVKDPSKREQAMEAIHKYFLKNCQIQIGEGKDIYCSPPLIEKSDGPEFVEPKRKKLKF